MSDPITLTEAERESIADAAARAHGRGRFDPLWAAVHDLVAARLAAVTAELESWKRTADMRVSERRDAEAALAEVWKAEALPVISGLQDLGRALDLPPGERITGQAALEAVEALKAENARLRDTLARVEALALGWVAESARYTDYADGSTIPDTHRQVARTLAENARELRADLAGGDS